MEKSPHNNKDPACPKINNFKKRYTNRGLNTLKIAKATIENFNWDKYQT